MVGDGIELPPLSEKTRNFLKERLYPEASINNPIDVLATGTAAHYRACLDAMMDDDSFDCVFVNFVTPFFVDTDDWEGFGGMNEILPYSSLEKRLVYSSSLFSFLKSVFCEHRCCFSIKNYIRTIL